MLEILPIFSLGQFVSKIQTVFNQIMATKYSKNVADILKDFILFSQSGINSFLELINVTLAKRGQLSSVYF